MHLAVRSQVSPTDVPVIDQVSPGACPALRTVDNVTALFSVVVVVQVWVVAERLVKHVELEQTR